MRQLSHPNVIRLHACFEGEDTLRLVMEYAPGVELFDSIIAQSHYSEEAARPVFIQICRALAYLHERGIVTVIDGCQALPHTAVDVQALGCDFYAFSAHKMYGPTGIGALYGREALLETMPPWQGGGEMILRVSFEKTTYNELPHKFEAGTPNIAGAIGMGAAFEFLDRVGIDAIAAHEQDLLAYATERMQAIDGLRILGTAERKGPVISFVVAGAHANDIGTIVDHFGVALRTGHHCAMPVMQFFDVPATARVSFGCYTTRAEIDTFLHALNHAREMLG